MRPRFNHHGMYEPVLPPDLAEETAGAVVRVCPFSDEGPDEDALALTLFPSATPDERLGRYLRLYAGFVTEGEYRQRGSSGGVISWLLVELLRTGAVDAVIHVAPAATSGDRLFAYRVSTTAAEVVEGAKSRYYPIELSGVLETVKSEPRRYAVVGLPCFIKAVRRLSREDEVFRERVVCTVGLVCGQLKSRAFADCFAWQSGIPPGRLEDIDFRVKQPERDAADYAVTVRGAGIEKTAPVRDLFGADWGLGLFKYAACEYCDDVFAETADLAVGDAWMPEYEQDSRGTSIVIARSDGMARLLEGALREGRLSLGACSADRIAASQPGGLRHRREGLRYRLHLARKLGVWTPRKRVPATARGVPLRRRRKYRLREALRARSHDLWLESVRAGDLSLLTEGLHDLMNRYRHVKTPLAARLWARFMRLLRGGGSRA